MERRGQNKNIVHVVHVHGKFYPYLGGSTFHLLNLLDGINKQKSNFYFTILCENHTGKLPAREILSSNIEIIRFKSYLEIPFLLIRVSRRRNIGLIHAHNYRSSFFAYMAKFLVNRPLIIEMHSIYKVSFLKKVIGNFILKKADRIIVLSKSSKEYLTKVYNVNKSKIELIYNGVDIDFFKNYKIIPDVKSQYGKILQFISKFRIKNGYVGSIHSWQGVCNIIELAKRTVEDKSIGFLIIGDGPDHDKINNLIEKNNLQETVFLHHAIPREDIPLIYYLIDILLILRPSTLATETAIPLKPIEALACKKIIVGTRVKGLLEFKAMVGEGIHLFDSLDEICYFLKEFDVRKYRLAKVTEKLNIFSNSCQADNLLKIYYSLIKKE